MISSKRQIMDSEYEERKYFAALQDFRRARRRASLHEVLGRLTGKPSDLLPFDEIIEKFKVESRISRGLKEIPLDAIVGSVGRYSDFTREFFPKEGTSADRWAHIRVKTMEGGLPPIETYQIGEAYFVLDGNHRVSVARQMGSDSIRAYVTEIQTKIPITAEDDLDDVIIKAEYADFLEQTKLDKNRPEAKLEVTAPGNYRLLKNRIAYHQNEMEGEKGEEISFSEAALDWYENGFLPVMDVIRQRGMLRDFPNRTETDLYVWILKRRSELEEMFGHEFGVEIAAEDLIQHTSSKPGRVASRMREKFVDVLTPDPLESGPRPGTWRRETLRTHYVTKLFSDFLVPVSGEEEGWLALEQAIVMAKAEGDRLHGLHVVSSPDDIESTFAKEVKKKFQSRCEEAGLEGELVIDVGRIARKICEHARWMDIVIANNSHPPGSQPINKITSGFRTLIRRCSRPILSVRRVSDPIESLLLAYDGSSKANEALFIATYMAGKWDLALNVLYVIEDESSDLAPVSIADAYLRRREVPATFTVKKGDVAENILVNVKEERPDMIVMGGYGFSPMLEVVLGSAVDRVLSEAQMPVLFCR